MDSGLPARRGELVPAQKFRRVIYGDLTECIEPWARQLGLTSATVHQYRRVLLGFGPLLREHGLGIRREHIIAWRTTLVQSGTSATTANVYLAALRSFFAWLESERVMPNVTAGLRTLRATSPIRNILPATAIAEIIAAIPKRARHEEAARDMALFNLIGRTGIRSCEAARAKLHDLTEKDGRWVLFVQRKGHAAADDFVCLNARAKDAVFGYLAATRRSPGGDGPLFLSCGSERTIRRRWARYAQAAGYPGFSEHTLRHSAATEAIRRGAPIQDVRAMLGHSRLDTTLRYVHAARTHNPAEDLLDW